MAIGFVGQLGGAGGSAGAASAIDYGIPVQDLAALRAVPPALRGDKQQRLVEDANAEYRFDATGVGADDGDLIIVPDTGTGRWFKITPSGGLPGAHAPSHEDAGSDEISVAGLSGLLADDQNPTAHASDHAADTGSDALGTAAAGAIAIGDAAAVGAAETFSRSDHQHSLAVPAAPDDVTKAAAVAGTAVEPARADHKHDVSTAVPVAADKSANAEGTSTSLARADHKHDVATAVPVAADKSANAEGTSTSLSRADHKHDIDTAPAATIGTANSEGAASSLSRSDHGHDHGAQSVGSHHAAVIPAGANGFMTGADKTKLDGLDIGDVSLGNGYVFSTTITDADPGAGNFRFNNATQANATFMFVSDFSENGSLLSAIFKGLAKGSRIYIQETGDKTKFHLVEVGDGIVDAGAYVKVPITVVDTGASLTDATACTLITTRSGNILNILVTDTASLKAAFQLAIDAGVEAIFKIGTNTAGVITIGGADLPSGLVKQTITIVPDMSTAQTEADPPPKLRFTNGWIIDHDDQANLIFDGVDVEYTGTNNSHRWGQDRNGFVEFRNCTLDYSVTGSPIVRQEFDGILVVTLRGVKYTNSSTGPGIVECQQNGPLRLEDCTAELTLIGCECKGILATALDDNEIVNARVISSVVQDNGNGVWNAGSAAGEINVTVDANSQVSRAKVGSVVPTFTVFFSNKQVFYFRGQTTDATLTEIFLDGSTGDRLILATGDSFVVDATILGYEPATDDSASEMHRVHIVNNDGVVADIAVTDTYFSQEDNAAWDTNVVPDNTNKSVKIEVTGEAGKTIDWIAVVTIVRLP